jgi:hypothetical protein
MRKIFLKKALKFKKMNRVFLNNIEITNFETDKETIEFVEQLMAGKDSEFTYNDEDDTLSFELEGQGIIDVDASDLNEAGKLTIFGEVNEGEEESNSQ